MAFIFYLILYYMIWKMQLGTKGKKKQKSQTKERQSDSVPFIRSDFLKIKLQTEQAGLFYSLTTFHIC